MKYISVAIFALALCHTCLADEMLAYPEELQIREGVRYLKGTSFTGILLDRDSVQQMAVIRNGIIQDVMVEYHKNGSIRSKTHYVGTARDGHSTLYHENGQLHVVLKYQNDRLVDGTYDYSDQSGHLYKREVVVGGELSSTFAYKDGKEYTIVVERYPDKTVKNEGAVLNGIKELVWIENHPNGQRKEEGAYQAGKKHGKWNYWYDEGELKRTAIYDAGAETELVYENNVNPKHALKNHMVKGASYYGIRDGKGNRSEFVQIVIDADGSGLLAKTVASFTNLFVLGYDSVPEMELQEHASKRLKYKVSLKNIKKKTDYTNTTTGEGFGLQWRNSSGAHGYRTTARMYVTCIEVASGRSLLSEAYAATSAIHRNRFTEHNEQNSISEALTLVLSDIISDLRRVAEFAAQSNIAPLMNPVVIIRTNMGNMTFELYRDKAPKTVNNFLGYMNDGFYTGTIFHRVEPGNLIQGGGFDVSMAHRRTRPTVENEAYNGLRNERGTLAAAREHRVHGTTSQFFINLKDNPLLDHRARNPAEYGYCVFGRIIEGMDVAERIAAVQTEKINTHEDVPVIPVEIWEVKQIR